MKFKKEILVALAAIVALFLLYFGFNFLKGVNIFVKTNTYVATFEKMNGLVEQAPVYVKGYKVGQVDKIIYDFTKEESFTVTFSINDDIQLPIGTDVTLVPDGLISGEALELSIPTENVLAFYNAGDTLSSSITPGMLNAVAEAVMTQLEPILENVDSILTVLKTALNEEQLKSIMDNVDGTMAKVNSVAGKANNLMANDVPTLVDSIQLAVNNLRQITGNLAETDFNATVARVDTAVTQVNSLLEKVNSTDGTLGLLLNDKNLYQDINNTVNSADSLLIDLKENPKRYVHFSLFGSKDKKK